MAQKTNLNVAPYYDDFNSANNFNRILFRPGFAVQGRELTQLQTALQDQIRKHGDHVFQEGAMVVPGQISFNTNFNTLKLATQFNSENIDPSKYFNETTPVTITGETTGVKARVIGFSVGNSTEQPVLHIRYMDTGTDNVTSEFSDGENISADVGITHTTSYSSNVASATTFTATSTSKTDPKGPASAQGSIANIESGIYYIRGMFVQNTTQTLVLSKYSTTPSLKVGFNIEEKLITPEDDNSLLDNATGSSNFAAKGGHRLQINLTLASQSLTSTEDDNFVQLMKLKSGRMTSLVRITEYSVLEETLARRTFDESGDYTVRPFTFSTQESVTIDDNEGIYVNGSTTDDGGTASDSLLAFKVSPGKAYVKGFEIEKIAPTIKDVNKARDTQSVNNGATTFGLGNYTLVENVFNTPDITADSGSIVEFGKVEFFEFFTASRGTTNTTLNQSIGCARVRHFEYHSGTVASNMYSSSGHTSTQYKMYLFDIKPFTKLTMSGTISATLVEGDKVTGSTSGATGLVHYQDSTKIFISKINGEFQTGETINISDRASATSETISTIRNYQFSDFKQVGRNNLNGTNLDFTADLVQADTFKLTGVYRNEETAGVAGELGNTGNQDYLQGLSNFNINEVRLGDTLEINTSGSTARGTVIVDGLTSSNNDRIGLRTGTGGNSSLTDNVLNDNVIRKRSKLFDAEKNISVVKLPKDVIKTTSDTIYTVRRQHIITVASSVITLPTLTSGDETYAPFNVSDYSISMITTQGSPPANGDHMEISAFGGTDTARTLAYASIGNGDVVKVIATVRRSNNVAPKTKSVVLSKALKVLSAGEGNYGIFSDDKDISFGRADVFKLQAIYDSESTSDDAIPPKLTVTSINGSFTRGEVITGGTSGAKARIITSTSPIYYVLNSETNFVAGEIITGEFGLATATVATVTDGSTVITGNFTLDTGQRDNYYDTGRIVRKANSPIPTGRLLVIYDYMEHTGTGDFFSVNSYVVGSTGINLNPGVAVNQMDYNDIPTYSATKVDPDQKEPSGQFPLADCFDFRPRVDDVAGTQTGFYTDGGGGVDQITGNSFNFGAREFTGTGASSLNFPKPNTVISTDFDFYLNKKALVYISKDGEITVKEGASAEVPQLPKPNEGCMLLADLFIPAYTFEPKDVTVNREKNQRFTMKDIGKLKDRIENVEYYTALNMLERDAESFEVQDANGLSRFKSGFVVDNFSGHRVGDVNHVDYRVGMDFENGELRPIHHTEAIKLVEKDTVDTARTSSHYQKTGDLLTLPYTEEQFTSQPYATTVEKVTPLLTSNWLGKLEITPSSDEWFETEIAPRLVINVEGNYNTFLAANQDKVGTVWNAWQTSWSGVVRSSGLRRRNEGNFTVTRVIETTRTNLTRQGIRTEVVPKVDEESQGFRKLYDALVPFCRSTSIQFNAWGLKPNTKVYPFFDKKLVTAHVTPLNTNYTSGTATAGQPLVTDPAGNLEGTFLIPDPKVRGNIKFETGEVQFRLTSSATDAVVPDPSTAADTIYFAKGILETHQETIIATRNAEVVRTSVGQTTSKFSTQNRIVSRERNDNDDDNNNGDPLAQTFMVDEEGGLFITSIDLFFAQKDSTLPMWVEIRNVVNGYPGPKILPFGTKVIYPSDVTTSADGSVATKVTFPAPVYVEGGVEYTIALLTAAQINTWSVFIARMGEVEIGGDRTVSLQPHIGVLFKSHNNRAWAMSGMEDLKFNINRAKFDNSASGTVTLNNTGDATVRGGFKKLLPNNPVRFTQGSNNLRISHRNHGMYDRDTNRVTISGVDSGLSTTLNGGITNSATTINLVNGTLFNETSGKYKHDSSNFHFIKIDDEIIKYTNASISGNTISAGSVTRGVGGTTAVAHSSGATVEYFQLFTVPLHVINRTHNSIGDVEGLTNGNQLDFYTVDLIGLTDFTAVAEVGATGESINAGGKNVTATQNKMLDGLQTMIGVMELPETTITGSCKATSGTSPSGTQSSFTKDSTTKVIPLNDNYYFDVPKLIASPINEQLTSLNSNKSLDIILSMKSTRDTLSPVIDTQRMSIFAIGNRINKVTNSGAFTVSTNASPSTDPEGDDNAAIYCTKQVLLENPATAIKMFFSGNVGVESDVVGMFKILRIDDASDFDDIGWQFFNTTGAPDTAAKTSLSETDFQQFMYTAGVTDDGLGTALEPFIGFAIKLILQGTNSAQVPRLKDFRAIALAT